MKNCKKLGVLLLALIMVTTSGVMSFADGDAAAGSGAETAIAPAAEIAADGEQTESQDSTVSDDAGAGETDEHAHLRRCTTCEGTGKIAQPADMTLYEEAYEEFELMVVEGKINFSKENAIICLKNHGVDVTEEFATRYAKYMAKAAENAWSIDQIVNHKEYYGYLMGWGDGTEESALAAFKEELDVPVKTADYSDCPDCVDGNVRCTGEFDEGVLTADNGADGGVLTHTCSVCGAQYATIIDAAEVPAALAKNLVITSLTPSVSATNAGGPVIFTFSVINNGKFAVEDVKLPLKLAEGFELTDEKVWVSSGADSVQIEGSEIEITLGSIKERPHEIRVYAKLPEKAAVGTIYDALTLEKAFIDNDAKTPLNLPEDSIAKVRVNKYKGRNVALAGSMLAWNYGNDAVPEGALADSTNLGMLDDIVGKVFRFENFDASYTAPERDNIVINSTTQKAWQCVGFIPVSFNNSQPDVPHLLKQVFSSTEHSLADVQKHVTEENKGVLYGEAATEDQLSKWQDAEGGYSTIFLLPVWYVMENPIKLITYEDLSITPVNAPLEVETYNGITVECTNAKEWDVDDHSYYEADILVTIGKDAPSPAHVNLDKALAAAAKTFNDGANVEPGDIIYYTLTIKNESGREYVYVNKSGIIATKNMNDGGEKAGKGFDGFELSKYKISSYSSYARRILNAPLRALGINNREKMSDASIGAALRELGYGEGIENDEDVTKQCLGNYYLDWINSVREAKGEKEYAENFEELTSGELAVLTGGTTGGAVPETCQPVVEALYYFYYGHILTFNEKSIYNQMTDIYNYKQMDGNLDELPEDKRPELETAIPAAMEGTPYQFKVKVAGNEANNGFQNTKFAFRIEFDLEAKKPTPTPTPTPTPDPEPTPDPTPEPDPQPLPPDDPLEEPDKPTVDPQPLPSDDPLIEDEDPKQPLPEDEHLADPDQPKTGDESDLALWLGVMILASGAVVTMRVKRKKEDQN